MSKIELYTSRSRFGDIRIQLAVVRQVRIAIRQTVSHNVARTHLLKQKFTIAPCGKLPLSRQRRKVRHHRKSRQATSLDNGVDRRPGWSGITKCPSIMTS